MIKIPFHCCDNSNVMFSIKINPFCFFYDKSILNVEVRCCKGDKILIFQNKKFTLTNVFHKTIDTIDIKIQRSLNANILKDFKEKNSDSSHFLYPKPKNQYFKMFKCCLNCTAHIIENESGYIRLGYDYSHRSSKFKSFNYFWTVEFKRNSNRYLLSTAMFMGDKSLALIQDNFVIILKCCLWKFGIIPILKMCSDMDWDLSSLLKKDVEMGFVLINSSFNLSKDEFTSKNVMLLFIFDLKFIVEKDMNFYVDLKKIDKDANHVLIFSNVIGKKVFIMLKYYTVSQSWKKIKIYKNKKLFNIII